MSYEFTIGKHAQQAHDYVSALIDGAYSRKNSGNPTTPSERVSHAEAICESYYEQVGQQPPSAVLSRLAWYLVFDEMTDSHPDKMTREEFPIISAKQLFRRADRHKFLEEVVYGDREHNGRRKTSFTDDQGSPQVRNNRMSSPQEDDNEAFLWCDLIDSIIDGAKLTDRQRDIVTKLFLEEKPQAEVSAELGISRQMIHRHYTAAFDKMAAYARKIGKGKLL